ncbi:uncharacterized protein LOC133795174 [Humulus lupulus]|uniref:uncharacterized protein LOC133795174 n=1 Tax=Humulus lupulus TaxID=3486 RepID=UPI002B40AE20|nr:uncharacterized protein LOC133795174 [Humulus lupulus]
MEPSIVTQLINILQINPYSIFFRSLGDLPDLEKQIIHKKTDAGLDQRVFNAPTSSQVAVIWVENDDRDQPRGRNILVYNNSGGNHKVQYYFGCYDPLQYPILFPFGDTGWHRGIQRIRGSRSKYSETNPSINPQESATAEELLATKERGLNHQRKCPIVSCREYYCYKLQIRENVRSILLLSGRLLHQFLVDMYVKIETSRLDYFRGKQQHIRSELYQGIVDTITFGETNPSNVGKRIILPSSFIGEITNELTPHEESQNRPNLVARVFHAKLEELKDQLFKRQIFGKVSAYVYVIEHQKRGLPHAHFLIILQNEWKLHAPESFDEIVSAEIPDQNTNIHLHNAVVKHMMHGPCGVLNPSNVCMKGNRGCKSNYPKNYASAITVGNDCFPIYRRSNNGMTVKYIYKGHDRVAFNLVSETNNQQIDEIQQFQSARWIAPPEAMWRIYGFIINEMSPAVYSLHLHLEDQHPITFQANDDLINIHNLDRSRKTMPTQFFALNRVDENAKKLLYKQIPEYYVWNHQHKEWTPRKTKTVIGRIVTANPFEGERYFMRILINHVRGPLSFEDLRTIEGILAPTFREAATMHGLLQRDSSLENCLHEASLYQMPSSLRRLFATILVYCNPTNPRDLWERFEEDMSIDFKSSEDSTSTARYHVLREIDDELGVEIPEEDITSSRSLNSEQQQVYNAVLEKVLSNQNVAFFVDGLGGTGKTFLYRALLATIRSRNLVALATASLGVAASILPGGQTAHSRFKLPLDIDEKTTCCVSKQSALANLLRAAKLIIWDEAPMTRKQHIEALDKMLRDINDSNVAFGGKVVVFGGDFR